jgi:threonine dehydrogenase-like Zn-dependent dehydrogenase
MFSPKVLVVTDLFQTKLNLAKKYGATHTYKIPSSETSTMSIMKNDFPEGFDVVIPCLLEGDGMIDAIDCCAQNGRIVMYGCIGICNKPLDFFKVHRKRLDILSTEPKRDIDMRRFWNEGVELVTSGQINTSEMITHMMPLSQIQQAFQLREKHQENVIHVMIDCEK